MDSADVSSQRTGLVFQINNVQGRTI